MPCFLARQPLVCSLYILRYIALVKIDHLQIEIQTVHRLKREKKIAHGQKPGQVDSKLDSRLKGHGFESCLIQH